MWKQLLTTAIAISTGVGCAVASPLTDGPAAGEEPPTGQYTVSVTHFVWSKADGASDTFFAHVDILADKVTQADGNIGSSLRRQFGGRNAWTLTIWLDDESMYDFVASDEHQAAIVEVLPYAEVGRTARFYVTPDDYPPTWDHALDQLDDAPGYEVYQ